MGTQPDLKTWEFPAQIHACVQTAAGLVASGVADKVITSGKWSFRIEKQALGQPFDECDRLADLLIAEGVGGDNILRERLSLDTISNLYYVKTQYLIPQRLEHLLFVVASFRIPRLQYLVRKVLGPAYQVDYRPIESEEDTTIRNESRMIKRTADFLALMQDGNHEWLADKFYGAPFYAKITGQLLAELQDKA